MSSVFSNLKPQNKAQRNGFDLSRRTVFSAKCGQIVPCFCQATLPDSEYKIDVKQLLRTQPLQTAAFTGFTVNYDFFFVPNNFSYSSFNEFISQRVDARHVGQPSYRQLPTFDFEDFVEKIVIYAAYDYLISEHCAPSPYGYNYDVDAAYHDGRRDARFCFGSSNCPWASVALEIIRMLDMLGYGNYLPLVKVISAGIWSVISPNIAPTNYSSYDTIYSELDAFYRNVVGHVEEMLKVWSRYDCINYMIYQYNAAEQSLGYGVFPVWIRDAMNGLSQVYPTLWPVLAYNKAFYEFYRSAYYDEQFSICVNDEDGSSLSTFDYVQLFNFDDWTNQYQQGQANFWPDRDEFKRLLAMFTPKYHLYKKDLFTGVLPSTQFGDVSVMVSDTDFRRLLVKNDSTATLNSSELITGHLSANQSGAVYANGVNHLENVKFRFDPAMAISVLEQRRADAMQRFKERMLRAGNKVKDIFKAHGWSEPYSSSESNPIFLGTFDGRLDINTVAATSPNRDVELGQLGANGVAVVSGNEIRFKCHDFGYIVGVFYIVKDCEYDAYGVERQHCLVEPFDYPYPELQNISLFPVDVLELSNYIPRGSDDNNIVGYLPRFMEFKTAVDKVHGEFHSAPILFSDKGTDAYSLGGVFSDWVTPRRDINDYKSLGFLYQSPMIADNVFLTQADATQSSDQFLVNCLFDVMAVEPVTVIGLPV